jgi:hypothetical protein
MLAIYLTYQQVGNWVFAASLVSLLYSLWMSVREILISVEALDVHLDGMKHAHKSGKSAVTSDKKRVEHIQ